MQSKTDGRIKHLPASQFAWTMISNPLVHKTFPDRGGRILARRANFTQNGEKPALAAGNGVDMNIFVGNLPASATVESLRRLFADYGTTVNVIIMRDTDSGQPLGYGHVYVVPEKAAHEAILNLQHARLDGSLLSVRECVYRAQHDQRTKRMGWKGSERRAEESRRLNDFKQSALASFQQRAG
jgi:RNA recognition motif-containing protein